MYSLRIISPLKNWYFVGSLKTFNGHNIFSRGSECQKYVLNAIPIIVWFIIVISVPIL